MALRREIAELFPTWVAGHELERAEQAEPLYPEEQQGLEKAVAKRRNEYALGRTAARVAMRDLGLSPVPLVSNVDRSVAWPDGVWGSITHAEGLCAAVVTRREQARGIGIDVELRRRVEEKLWRMIATEREQARLGALDDPQVRLEQATILFSAKEAFYKAQFCVTRSWVGFHDAEVTLEASRGFRVHLLKDVGAFFRAGATFAGKYALLDRHVATGLWIPPR